MRAGAQCGAECNDGRGVGLPFYVLHGQTGAVPSVIAAEYRLHSGFC